MPPPKAISQGSNGAGGGAFRAFTGRSAAKADPAIIVSAVADNATFFMTIPFRPRYPKDIFLMFCNVNCGILAAKPKYKADADFLSEQEIRKGFVFDKHHDPIDHDCGRSAKNQTQVGSDAIA